MFVSMSDKGEISRFILEGIADIPLVFKRDWTVLFAGTQIGSYGYLPENLVGVRLTDLIHPDDRGPLADFFSGKQDQICHELVFRLKKNNENNEYSWFELKFSPARHEKDAENQYFGTLRDITDRKLSEDALREKEARYHALSDSAVDSIFILKDGVFIDLNSKTEEVFGLKREEIVGKSPVFFSPLFQPDGRRSDEKVSEFLNKVLEGIPQIFEWVHLKGDGSEFHTEVSLTRVLFRKEFYILAIVRDISERKSIEKKVIMLASIVEQAAESVIITDLEGTIEYVNPAFENKTGYLSNEVKGKKPSILKSGKHSPDFYRTMWSTILKGDVWRGIIVNRNRDGNELIEDSLLSPIRNNDGKIIGFLAVKRDVTDEFRLQEKIKASEKLFRTVFENAPGSMSITRMSDQKYVAVNPSFIKSTGLEIDDVIGKTASEIGFSIYDFDTKEFFDRLKKRGVVHNQIMRIIDPLGKEKCIIFSSTILDFEGEPCILSMSVDITESKKLEERLRHSQKMDAIGQLAGGIAHDFNNMLSGILGGAELLSFLLPPDSPLVKHAETIARSAGMASELTKKLLSFSRKGNRAEMAMVDVHECIRIAISILERSIGRNISIETNLVSSFSTIKGEVSTLQNIFLNLGINARDAMKDGGKLSFSTSDVFLDDYFCRSNSYSISPGNYIQIDVSDTGSGIPRKIIDRIFEPFFTTKEPGKGTGLGLSGVYGTVKEHGGAINVYSEEGMGTVFRIYLPLVSDDKSSDNGKTPEIQSGSGVILLVDDESVVRDTACEILKTLGYEVIMASDGEEALSLYKKNRGRISVVLMDMVMPGISGWETFRRLKKECPEVRVVFTSGFSQEGVLINLSEPGVCGFIHKPYRISELSTVIASAIKDGEHQ